MERATVKLFNRDERYGFIGSEEGDVFFHWAYVGHYRFNGGDEPVFIRGGEKRMFEVGDEVVFEKEITDKGWRGSKIAYAQGYDAVVSEISGRTLKRLKYKGAVVLESKNEQELIDYVEKIEDPQEITYEECVDGQWVEIA